MIIYNKLENQLLAYGLSHAEFRCRCNYKECKATLVNEQLIKVYGKFRSEVDTRLRINSGYRCQRHNQAVGGVNRSRHIAGEAIDIDYESLKDDYTVDEVIDKLKSSGFNYIKWYQNEGFFHCDVGPIYNR